MQRNFQRAATVALVLGCASLTSGCASPFARGNAFNTTASKPVITDKQLDEIDIKKSILNFSCESNCPSPESLSFGEAFSIFYQKYKNNINGEEAKLARNSIQSQVMLASQGYCGNLRVKLMELETEIDLISGIAGTATGTLGAFATGGAAQWLSATAGIASGTAATFDTAFLKNRTTDILISGINMATQKISIDEIGDQTKKSITDYTLERAILDGMRYNYACSIAVALDTVKTALAKGEKLSGSSIADDAKIKTTKDISNLANDQLVKLITLDKGSGVAKAFSKDLALLLTTPEGKQKIVNAYAADILEAKSERLAKIATMVAMAKI